MSNVEDQVRQLIADCQGIPVADVGLDQELKADLDLDSLDTWELVQELEDGYQIVLHDSEVRALVTVLDVVSLVQSKVLANQKF